MPRTRQNARRSTGESRRRSLAAQASRRTVREAATTTSWHVWLVNDRLGSSAMRVTPFTRYRVEYIVAPGRTEVAYTPRWILEEDGFGEYLQLVDDYKDAGGPQSFAEYVATRADSFALAIGDSASGRCGFHALARGATALEVPVWFSWTAVDGWYTSRAAVGRPIPPAGVVWTTLFSFIQARNRAMRAVGSAELCEYTLQVNQRQQNITGAGACLALEHLLLMPGVYLCAGYHPGPHRRSHAFLLEVTTQGHFASDSNVLRQLLLESAFSWLECVQFVQRLVIRSP